MNAIRSGETFLLRVLPVLIVAAAWEAVSQFMDPQLVPSLSAVVRAWAEMAVSGELIHNTVFSLVNLSIGLVLGLSFGTALGVLMAWYPVVNNTIGAIVQMTFPQTLIWSALALGATRRQALYEVVFRAAIPDILAGIRSALAIGFVLMVTSEFLIGQRGLGYLIAFYGDAGLYPAMFAAVLTVAALGFIADRLYLQLMQRLLLWRG
jgi:ABC-type nitrate/sulfonate/bicarbonate transport system permease component